MRRTLWIIGLIAPALIGVRAIALRSGLECRMEISPSAASGVVLPAARSGPGSAPDPIGAFVSTAVVAIHPIELDDVISNPGMGLQTFYNTKATDPNNGTLPLGSAYTRYYWSDLAAPQPRQLQLHRDGERLQRGAGLGSGLLHSHQPVR